MVAYISRECLAGMEYLHSNKIIHRDIKGQNVLLTRDLRVKLVDFGVCALLQEQKGKRDTVIGTPYWMAPEVRLFVALFLGTCQHIIPASSPLICLLPQVITCEAAPPGTASYDAKCDVWSLGITAIEIADGQPPLSKMPAMKALYKIPQLKPPTLSSNHKWSKRFHDFLAKALTKNPAKRPRALELSTHPFVAEVSVAVSPI